MGRGVLVTAVSPRPRALGCAVSPVPHIGVGSLGGPAGSWGWHLIPSVPGRSSSLLCAPLFSWSHPRPRCCRRVCRAWGRYSSPLLRPLLLGASWGRREGGGFSSRCAVRGPIRGGGCEAAHPLPALGCLCLQTAWDVESHTVLPPSSKTPPSAMRSVPFPCAAAELGLGHVLPPTPCPIGRRCSGCSCPLQGGLGDIWGA